MLKLRAQVLAILEKSPYRQSIEAEADLILFHVMRREYPHIKNLSDLRTLELKPSSKASMDAIFFANDRAAGVPLQHVLGEQYFFNHDYQVNASTLIPRPETEILVHEAIQYAAETYGDIPFRFAELGLGSGIISAELLCHFKNATAVASELNPDAIQLAKQNLKNIVGESFAQRIQIIETPAASVGFELFTHFEPFQLILSNPPYVSSLDEISQEVLQNEPGRALFPERIGGHDNPDYFYENFLAHGQKILAPGGTAFFEVPHERAQSILVKFKNTGFNNVTLIPDLTGRDRVLQASF